MRIALWNGSGLDNHGDRLLDHVNRVELAKRLPSVTFVTFCPWSEEPDCNSLSVDLDGRWCGEGEFDAIIIGGGALLMGPPFSHPGMQSFFLGPYPERFRDDCFVSWNAVCSGSQFAAPLAAHWKEYVQAAARRIEFYTVRNFRTREFLLQCDVAEDPAVVPDPVVLIREPRVRQSRVVRRRRIGIAVARPVFPEEFLRMMGRSAAAGLAATNPLIVRLPSALSPESYDERRFVQQFGAMVEPLVQDYDVEIAVIPNIYGDHKPSHALASLLGDSCRTVTVLEKHSRGLITWIESLDCLVASRLHYCVLALAAGTPVVALDPYYSSILSTSKLGEFMAAAQGTHCWVPLTEALEGVTTLADLVERALSLQTRLGDAHARLWDAATVHFDQLAERIRSGERHRE
jgi:polysaccharide pyruvyl transferase WcaK-like protein